MKCPKTPFSPCRVLNNLLTAAELIDIAALIPISRSQNVTWRAVRKGRVPWKPVGAPPFPWEYLEVLC